MTRMQKTFQEIDEIYDLEIERVVSVIRKQKAKTVLLQFPDGMKPYAAAIAEEIENKTQAKCAIWLGSCFGACDVPQVNDMDLVIQFGHSEWR